MNVSTIIARPRSFENWITNGSSPHIDVCYSHKFSRVIDDVAWYKFTHKLYMTIMHNCIALDHSTLGSRVQRWQQTKGSWGAKVPKRPMRYVFYIMLRRRLQSRDSFHWWTSTVRSNHTKYNLGWRVHRFSHEPSGFDFSNTRTAI
jgi:hypothetical protein